jgi:hypothetical protein
VSSFLAALRTRSEDYWNNTYRGFFKKEYGPHQRRQPLYALPAENYVFEHADKEVTVTKLNIANVPVRTWKISSRLPELTDRYAADIAQDLLILIYFTEHQWL